MKRWKILHDRKNGEDILTAVMHNRKLGTQVAIDEFLKPADPHILSAVDVGIDQKQLQIAIERIKRAIKKKESILVYTDYDVDGITGGAILWETLHNLGANVMPYVPHREREGYGFSKTGINNAYKQFKPSLIISVDHGITAREKITYAKNLGIGVIVTDHHTMPAQKPNDAVAIVHTTKLAGAGVSWFFAKKLVKELRNGTEFSQEYLALAAMGTIADLLPLTDVNRSIAQHGLKALNKTNRIGLQALFDVAGIEPGFIESYHIGYGLGPRINAAGRLAHALDALRLLCTRDQTRAVQLARSLNEINTKRQQVLENSLLHAYNQVGDEPQDLLFVADQSYNQGIIGLIAGRLVERFYRPAIALSQGKNVSKASARSIRGVNIVEMLRKTENLLVDVGGHPMAAGFTVETKNLPELKKQLTQHIKNALTDELVVPKLNVDAAVAPSELSLSLYYQLQKLKPFGVGNPRPVFAVKNIQVKNIRLIGRDKKHLKLVLSDKNINLDAIGFNMGQHHVDLSTGDIVSVAFNVDENVWNNTRKLQLKLKDIKKAS